MGWHPYLRIISGDRSQARVHLPTDLYGVVDTIDGRPTGGASTPTEVHFGGRTASRSLAHGRET